MATVPFDTLALARRLEHARADPDMTEPPERRFRSGESALIHWSRAIFFRSAQGPRGPTLFRLIGNCSSFPPQQAEDTAAAFADVFGDELATKSCLATGLEATRTYVKNELEKQDLRLTIRLGTMLTVAIVLAATLVKLL